MITLERFNAVIDYVEHHLTDELDLNHLANLACSSKYNFQRMFALVAGMSITEYIRKRRLTLAGIELQCGTKVIDAALKYGYKSPVSFARAFQTFHKIAPSEVKKTDKPLNIFPRITFQVYVKELNEVKLVRKEELYLCGFLVEQNGGDLWEKYLNETRESPELLDWTAHEVRFYTPKGECVFTACRQKENVCSLYHELLVVPPIFWAVFDIDHKIEMNSQYGAVTKWLDEHKNSYKQMQWNANGRVELSDFVIYWYDHQNKFGKERIMEMWVPLVEICEVSL